MRICLNGEMREMDTAPSVQELLAALKLDARKIAVEVNLAIVPRSRYPETVLRENDAVEIVRFIGGG